MQKKREEILKAIHVSSLHYINQERKKVEGQIII